MRWPSSPQKPLLFVVLLGTCLARLVGLAEGYAWCSEYWNWDGKRIAHDGCRWPAGDGVVITYINGIFHSVPEWENITNQLQAIFGHEVRPFYNPSSGWWITDASKAGYHLLRKPANDAIAQALGEHLAQAVEDVGRGRVLHIAHSGGALITYLAAQHHLTRRQRDKIDVLTFGGARSITRKYFSGRVVNYYARNDPLVKLDRRAAELMKLTNNTNFQEISEKHNTTFIFLEGKARQFVVDHSLEGPTYQHALQKEARAFRRAHFGPLSPLSWDYDSSLLRLARKKVAQLSGIHGFFSSEYLGLRSLRKTVARFTSLHGFFSGKVPSTGIAIAVVGSEQDGDPEPQSGGTSGFGRRFWWPWSARKGDDVVVSLPEAETPDTASRGQFWLGFRWGKQEEPEAEAGGSSIVLDAGKDDDEQDVDVTGSGWSRARGIWGFGRSDSSRPGVVEMEMDVLSETGDDELISPRPPGLDGVAADESAQEIGRPWLSMAWTPWGPPARKLDVDVVASEAPSNPAAVEESDVVADAGERSAQGSENGDGAASQEDETLLSRWWPRSSLRAAGATNEEDSEGEQGGRGLDGVGVVTEEGEESADRPQHDGALYGDTEVYVAKEEQQTLLRRWWPVAKEATPAEVLEEDGVGVSKEAGGEVGEFLNSSPEEAGKGIDVDMVPAPSPGEPGLTSRLWPPIFKAAGTSGDGSGDAAPTVEQQPVSRSQREEIPPSRDDREGGRQLVGEVIVTEESIPLDEEDPSSEEGESEPGDSEEGDGAGKEGETEAEDGVEDSENVDEGGVDVGGQAQEEGEREGQEGSRADEGFPSQDDPGHSVSDNVEGVGGSDLSSSNLGVDTALAGGDVARDSEGVVASTSGAPTTKSEATLEEPDDVRLEANEEQNPASEYDSAGAGAAASEGASGENAAAASPIRQKQPTVGRQWGWQR